MRTWALLASAMVVATAPAAPAQETGGWLADAVSGCEVWSTDPPRAGEGVSWSGACRDGKAIGYGVLVWWDETGLQGRYFGEMAGGKLDGAGRLVLRDEAAGGFTEYLGRFAESRPVGKGFLETAAGARFQGELLDGLSHGRGVLVTPEGALIRGEFRDGEAVGQVLVRYETEEGERYVGEAEDGARHGYGLLVAADDDLYVGRFAEGEPHGPGIYQGTGGDRYLGEFADGRPTGFGSAMDAEGNVIQGRFVEGEPDGTVLVTTAEGRQEVTTWQAGETN